MHVHGRLTYRTSWVVILLGLLYMCLGFVESQNVSKPATDCTDLIACPCCSVQCPSDLSGQCGGMCKDGYHGGKCYNLCPDNCKRCVDAQQGVGVSNCTLCTDGYYSPRGMYQCQSKCSSNCTTCESTASHCTSCQDGYYLSGLNACHQCMENCSVCNSSTICTICKDGYYLDQADGMCQQCNPLCYSCTSYSTCICSTGCLDKFAHVCSNVTRICDAGCKLNFKYFMNSSCDECVDGKYGYDCDIPCKEHCKNKCERINGACLACSDGYHGNYCNVSCPENCESSCDMHTAKCEKCPDGYYSSHCNVSCPEENCLRCNITNGTCETCREGYYGIHCDKNCSINCLHSKCNKENGSCACKPEFEGPACAVVVTSTVMTGLTSTLMLVVAQEHRNYVGPTAGGTLTGIAVVVSVVVVIIVYKRRRAFKYVRYDIDFYSYKLDARLIDVLEENDEFDPTYFTGKVNETNKPCGKLPVKELSHFVATHGEDFYQEEFLKLPRGLIKSCEDAKKEENVVKNRYTGIYPYDEHRVRLQPPGSDFINACYMDGFKRKNEYIASLGPTRKAMEGFHLFWRMVWQEKTDVIVMVTNLMEGQSMKCEQYWPDIGSSVTYGEIMVTSQTEDVYAEFVVRSLTVTKDGEERKLHLFHYTAWPDKRVPDDITSLIEFRQKVKATVSKLGGPTIVHCSAGIGRTGTYIALDILIHQGKTQKSLDIFEWVTRMREHRTSMVQTWQQYEYLHRALLHALTYHCEPVKVLTIELFMDGLNDKKITQLFKQLDRKQEKPTDGEQEARDMNKNLLGMNRDYADIPGSSNRPFLHLDKMFGENNYINAVFLNSYTVKDRFLVCQTPLPDTVKDFLTLIIQESCCCIVSMDPPGLTDQTVGEYYPVNAGTVYTHPSYVFDVEAQDLDTNLSYNLRRLTINFNKRSGTTSRTVYHFQCQHWPQGNRVPTVSHFLQLIQDVENMADRDSGRGPILVHCLNAAERSGLYCGVSNLVQKVRVEGEVSVVNTLRQVKVRRPFAIPNKEQYMFCYRCLHQFVKSQNDTNEEAVYGNID